MAEEEEEGTEAPEQVLSDTGLFYLYYQNDSGRAVASNARNDVDAEFFARMDAAASRSTFSLTLASPRPRAGARMRFPQLGGLPHMQ